MKESWRWYGDLDAITLPEVAQSGAAGIVTALHEIPYGEVWSREAIARRRRQIEAAGFQWVVVESLPVHERIKLGEGDLTGLFDNYRQSMRNLAAEGILVICYNFMPLLDWTRTDLDAPAEGGAHCLRFDAPRMAAFELHMLGRREAVNDYPPQVVEAAGRWFAESSQEERDELLDSIMAGLPGAFDRYTVDTLRQALRRYDGVDRAALRANYKRFLEEIIPTAEELGMRMCVHPDDPPRDILGLPRIVSSADDIEWALNAVPSPANGLTLCAGSLGAGPENDVPAIAARFAPHVHFTHLRNVRHDPDGSGSFEEASHLNGVTDIVAVIHTLMAEEKRRQAEGRADADIPFRPDHGHELAGDQGRGTHPGYPLMGRLRGLAELRGVIAALRWRDARAPSDAGA
ncbi:MAG: mannonate dehydratase [Rhodobacterales bacterium]|nr:mannonate dehydratase [Rhodobacterales bacterium]